MDLHFYYHWWTTFIKPRLQFSHCRLWFLRILYFYLNKLKMDDEKYLLEMYNIIIHGLIGHKLSIEKLNKVTKSLLLCLMRWRYLIQTTYFNFVFFVKLLFVGGTSFEFMFIFQREPRSWQTIWQLKRVSIAKHHGWLKSDVFFISLINLSIKKTCKYMEYNNV